MADAFVSGMSPTVFIAICTVVLTILTQFLHNVICAAVFLPMLTPIVVQMGGQSVCLFVYAVYRLNECLRYAGSQYVCRIGIRNKGYQYQGCVFIRVALYGNDNRDFNCLDAAVEYDYAKCLKYS